MHSSLGFVVSVLLFVVGCSGTPDPAREVTAELARSLERDRIAPNFDMEGRDRAQERFGDSHVGACSDLTDRLERAWTAAGVEGRVSRIAILKPTLFGRPRFDLNMDHVAWLSMSREGPVVFDLWFHGVETGGFDDFEESPWNGMPLGEWIRRMKNEGYGLGAAEGLGIETRVDLDELRRQIEALALG